MKKLDITAQKIVQHTLQSAMEGGPNCPCMWCYQPHRPEKPLPNRRTKSKSHAAVLSPSHLKCGGLFYACFSKNSQKVQIIREHFLRY